MPVKKDAQVIGRMDCYRDGCSERVAVYQAKNGYLYTRCPHCKADQRRSTEAQLLMWRYMEPLPGAVINRPRNVPETAGDIGCGLTGEPLPVAVVEKAKPETVAPAAASDDHEPQPQPTPAPAPETNNKSGSVWILAGLFGLTAAGFAALVRG